MRVDKVKWTQTNMGSNDLEYCAYNDKKGFNLCVYTRAFKKPKKGKPAGFGQITVRVWKSRKQEMVWFEEDCSLFVPMKVLQEMALVRLNKLMDDLENRGMERRLYTQHSLVTCNRRVWIPGDVS